MTIKQRHRTIGALISLTLLGAIFPQIGKAQERDIIAVLSSNSAHYKEALNGFRETMNRPIQVVNLQEEKFKNEISGKLIVTFGAKAAMYSYPNKTDIIVCMAPGVQTDNGESFNSFTFIEMAPRASVQLTALKNLQPGLKRLNVFWASPSIKSYLEELKKTAAAAQIQITLIKIDDASLLPRKLREIQGTADALMLPPDPLLVNAQNFTTIKDFSHGNNIPFYAPTAGLVEMGATASVSTSFREIGATAAVTAQKIIDGVTIEKIIYPAKSETVVNLKTAQAANIKITPDILNLIDRAIP